MSKEIIKSIHEAEDRIRRAKEYMQNSSYLNAIETDESFVLDFNEYSCQLNLIVKDNYRRLIEALQCLRAENIRCEFKHHFCLSEVESFNFSDGYIEVCFRCEKGCVPHQLEVYRNR